MDIDERKDSFASPFIKMVKILKLKSSVATSISGKKQVRSKADKEGKEQLGSYKVNLGTCRIAFRVQTAEQSSRAASYDPKTVRVGHGQAHGPNINNYFDIAVV